MYIIKFLEKNFWFPISLSLVIGLFVPFPGNHLSFLVIPILMFNFFLSCLKVDFLDVIEHIRKPKFLFYILATYLLIIPAVFYTVFHFINPDIAIGIMLLASMPPGVSSVVLTDIFKGNTSLSMALSIAAYLVSPLTISLLFFLLTKKQIHLDIGLLLGTLLLINFLPLMAAQIIRRKGKSLISKTINYYIFINICLISFMIYIVVAIQSDKILENPLSAVIDVVWLYALFIILYIIGYFCGFWKKKDDKIALAVTKTYMNNALAAGIAVTFFNPQIALLMVLSEVPWTTTQGIFKYITKHLD